MSDERFSLKEWEDLNYCEHCFYDGESLLSDSDVVVLLNDQQSTINRLEEENDNMNLFIKQTIEPLLFNCVFELDTIESMSQVELSRKIEDEIIPFIQDFKYLKYESLEEEKQDKSE